MKILGLIFTRGVSLAVWVEKGLLDREKQIYEEHLRQGHFDKVIWFTYGTKDDKIREMLLQQKRLDERIEVVPMPGFFSQKFLMHIYSYRMPLFQEKYCKQLDIIKTNQIEGAWTAEIIHRKYNIPFLLRTGYTYTSLWKEKAKKIPWPYKKAKAYWKCIKYGRIEKFLYHKCTYASVSSKHDKEYIYNQYAVPREKIGVITNYIDCELFKDRKTEKSNGNRFIFVGRLSAEKNLFHIIQALGELKIGLDIYGKGELQKELMDFAQQNRYDTCFKGIVNNNELPLIYSSYRYYILASPYEGMPKTLLEAMACGCICFGTNVDGIKEVLSDNETGYLIADTSVESIKSAVAAGIHREGNNRISENAVCYIQKYHSLKKVAEEEWEIMKRMRIYEQIKKTNL